MRAAPPVEAVVNAGGSERMVICLLHALAGAMLASWLAAHAELAPAWHVVAAALLAAGLMAVLGAALARHTLPRMAGRLRWDGQGWCHVEQADAPLASMVPLVRLVVALDLGVWVLLRLHPATGGAVRWRCASARGAQSSWHGLRLALAAHAGAAGVPADQAGP